MTVLENIFAKFEKWIIRPLRSDVRKHVNRDNFVSFVLISVAIDNLASIRYSREILDSERGCVRKRYQKFIKEYMPSQYGPHAKLLYEGFRCKVVHNFQLEGVDIRQSKTSRRLHLTIVENNNLCLNAQELTKDLLLAFTKLKRDMIGRSANKHIIQSFNAAGYKGWVHTG